MNPTALCLGELLIDLVSPRVENESQNALGAATEFLKAPGGAPANVAVGMARLGINSGFIGSVGADAFGDFLNDVLERENVETSALKRADARTTLAFVATRADGKKEIAFWRNPGADAQLGIEDLPIEALQNCKILHVGSVSLSLEPCREAQFEAVRVAKEAGALISFDPNWRPSLWDDTGLAHELIWQMMSLADIVKIADEEWKFVTKTFPDIQQFERGARRILKAGPKLVVMTRGAEGAWFMTNNASGAVTGHSVEAVDTLGAGDAFVAGLLSQILEARALETLDLKAAVRFANACGALATTKRGAIPSLPTREEVEAMLTQN